MKKFSIERFSMMKQARRPEDFRLNPHLMDGERSRVRPPYKRPPDSRKILPSFKPKLFASKFEQQRFKRAGKSVSLIGELPVSVCADSEVQKLSNRLKPIIGTSLELPIGRTYRCLQAIAGNWNNAMRFEISGKLTSSMKFNHLSNC